MNQFRPIFRISTIAILPSAILYVLVLYLSIKGGMDPIMVLRDPIQACDYPTNVGMISNIGVLMWASAASISLFTSISGLVTNQKWKKLLLLGGLLSVFLCLDDLFLLHDRHVGQNFIYLTYAALTIFILISFSKLIFQSDSVAFLTSSVFLGLSIISDKFQESLFLSYSTMQLYEEGFKFIGIACWLFFWAKTSIIAANIRSDK